MAVDGNAIIRNSFSVWAVIGTEKLLVDISAVTITYAVNAIPTASGIRVNVGRDISTGSTISDLSNKLKKHQNIDIRFAVLKDGAGGESIAAPDGAKFPKKAYVSKFPPAKEEGIIIFRGSISSVQFNRTASMQGNSCYFMLSATGFLNALTSTTSVNKIFSTEPTDDAKRAVNLQVNFATDNANQKLSGVTLTSIYLDKANGLLSDLWKNGISDILYNVAEGLTNKTSEKAGGTDKSALILKEDTVSLIGQANGSKSDDKVRNPAWMSSGNNDTLDISKLNVKSTDRAGVGIISNLVAQVLGTMLNQNAWDALQMVCNTYHLAVIPTIEAYAVVPWAPAISGAAFRKIYADEISLINESFEENIPIRRVILRAVSPRNLKVADDKKPSIAASAGVWPPKGDSLYDIGNIVAETRILDMPQWLDEFAIPSPYKDADAGKNEKDSGKMNALEFNKNALRLGTLYAKSLYFLSIYGQDGSNLAGRLRFDIGPGSLVEVETPGDLEDPKKESKDSIFGVVTSVSLSFEISGDSGSAYTSFNVTANRGKQQQNDDNYTNAKHPLFDQAWRGTPLMQDPGTTRK